MKKELPISLLNTTREVASGMHMPASGQAFSVSEADDGEALVGGVGDSRDPSDFDIKDLREGTKVEMEHTSDRRIAREIAMDHLTEDPSYYKKLKKVEARAKGIVKRALGLLDVPAGIGNFAENGEDDSVESGEVLNFGGIPENPGLSQESEEADGETTSFLKGRGDSGEDYNVEEVPPINKDIDKRGSGYNMIKELSELKKFLNKSKKFSKAKKIELVITKLSQQTTGYIKRDEGDVSLTGVSGVGEGDGGLTAGYESEYPNIIYHSKSCKWVGNNLPAYGMAADGELYISDIDPDNPYAWVGDRTLSYKLENYLDKPFTQTGDFTGEWFTFGGGGSLPFNEMFPLIQSAGDAYELLYADYKNDVDAANYIWQKASENRHQIQKKFISESEDTAGVEFGTEKGSSKARIKVFSESAKWRSGGQPMYGIGFDGQLYVTEGTGSGGTIYPLAAVLSRSWTEFSPSGDWDRELGTIAWGLFETVFNFYDEISRILNKEGITEQNIIPKLYDILYKDAAKLEDKKFIRAAKIRYLNLDIDPKYRGEAAGTPPAGIPPAATPPAGIPPAATPPAGTPPAAPPAATPPAPGETTIEE